ncbi:hypothetical protein ACWEN3_14505 [Streptomyces sp. NPDC004561]
MGAESVPRREVVTGRPRTRGGPTAPAPMPQSSTQGTDAVRILMHRQLRAGLTATALLVAPLGLLPVLLRVLPLGATTTRVPLAVWLLLGVAPYPALAVVGAWYVRRAERNESATVAPGPAEHS